MRIIVCPDNYSPGLDVGQMHLVLHLFLSVLVPPSFAYCVVFCHADL
jgi:hypothetical protein